MSNKEWMATLTAEQFYDVMEWLMQNYGRRYSHTQLAVIAWLDEPHKFADELGYYSPPHNEKPNEVALKEEV